MAGLSGIVKKISDLVTGTPADDDCFVFGKSDLKKITLAKLKDALGLVFTPRYDNLVDGSSFNKDFLSIYLPAHENRLNAANYFSKPAADSEWTNVPTELSGKMWLGYRAPQRMGGTNELIVIMEHFPVAGRIWTNYYNSGTWQGWKSITPE